MINPFRIPDNRRGDSGPLCPWDSNSHEKYYAPVDHTGISFKGFQERMEEIQFLEAFGGVILIEGLAGCGKTSLMHRCAAWLRSKLATLGGESMIILDLTLDGPSGVDKEARIMTIYRRIIDELNLSATFSAPELAMISARTDDPAAGYPIISRLLENNNRSLVVLLPSSELSAEISAYVNFARNRIVFFCESASSDVSTYFDTAIRETRTPPIRLKVGSLEVKDGWTFVNSRLSMLSEQAERTVTTDEATVVKFMETRINGRRGRTNILELHKTCLAVFEHAIKNDKDTISYADFAEYYMREAFL